jgi:hypothetical protein
VFVWRANKKVWAAQQRRPTDLPVDYQRNGGIRGIWVNHAGFVREGNEEREGCNRRWTQIDTDKKGELAGIVFVGLADMRNVPACASLVAQGLLSHDICHCRDEVYNNALPVGIDKVDIKK